jgi:uncharacterized protein with HEPN domain
VIRSIWVIDTVKEASERVAAGGIERFEQDEDFRLALAYRIQMIGEAARRVSSATQRDHPEIPWKQIIGMRHKIVHDYLSVDGGVFGFATSRNLGRSLWKRRSSLAISPSSRALIAVSLSSRP